MIELNDVIISQLKQRGVSFPNVKKGILVPMVSTIMASSIFLKACILIAVERILGGNTYG